MLKSRLLSSVRPFYAPPGDDNQGGNADDAAAGGAAVGTDDAAAGGAAADGGDSADDAAAGSAAAGTGGGANEDTPRPAGVSAEDWRDKEIRRKHAQLQAERRRAAELEAELETARGLLSRTGGRGDGAQAGGDDSGEPSTRAAAQQAPLPSEAAVEARAQELVAEQTFNNTANDIDRDGAARFKDGWKTATDRLVQLGGFDKNTMVQVMATDDPAQVLFELGSKPEEYQRIMELPGPRRQTELVKLGLKKPAAGGSKRPDPNVAPPVDTVRNRNQGNPTELRDDLDDDTWYARRAAQKKARFEARQRGA